MALARDTHFRDGWDICASMGYWQKRLASPFGLYDRIVLTRDDADRRLRRRSSYIDRVPAATQALGVSVATIYRMCDRGELAKGKIGNTRSVGIMAASVNAMLARMVPAGNDNETSTQPLGNQGGSQRQNQEPQRPDNSHE